MLTDMAWDAEFFHPFADERFSVMARMGCTAIGYWDGFRFHYDPKMGLTWTIGGNFYWPQYNTSFNLKVEQYLKEDRGVKFEMIRHFRYCSIAFSNESKMGESQRGIPVSSGIAAL